MTNFNIFISLSFIMHMGYHRNTLFCSTAITTNKFRSILSGVTLNLPAGLHGKKKQYSEEEVQENDKIATARVHVERAIGYVKKYRILDNRINRRIVPYLKEIFEVCTHLTTMQLIHMRELDESTTGLAESVSALTL